MTPAITARRTARGNRWGLALVGGVLVAAGAVALAVGAGLLGPEPAATELGAWPSGTEVVRIWLGYAVVAAAVLVGLPALRWMLVQGRTDSVRRVVVDPDGSGLTEMPSGAARGAFEGAVGEYAGVRRARARLTDSVHTPHVRLDLTVDEDADVPALWRRVHAEALEDLRTALELERLPAVIRLSMSAPPKNPRRNPA
ncbi:alkaline shock response membrane anchor protein AmaP [Streptomonospora sp. PA3]|uniref:alkaline shock response membrane anchor protein AmaP n=1 Tax=Streptomonospora sp. PA3 TaxID=2607326 RepID=UPI0012DF2751|nr:alkaline shock response membrane anchor protein AmaP [Streptomonospora sp. PA3]MUL39928.1 alkaline shock response membrane anchor protein AmaP [Streptomonospora sp. PA3]